MQWPWRKAETDLEREVRGDLDMLAEAHQRAGRSRAEAMEKARIDFGGVDQVKEQCRDIRWWSWLAELVQDARYGVRVMRRTPAITIAAIISLALGIGATTTILSLADALLWRLLPVPEPQQLTELFWTAKDHPDGL